MKQYARGDMRYVQVTLEVSVVINTLEPKEEHQDDEGMNFVTFVHSHSDETTKRCSFWMMPDSLKSKDLAFSFEVRTTDSEVKKADCKIRDGQIDETCLIKHYMANAH